MNIAAIIVLYNPNLEILHRNLSILLNNCNVVLINNGEALDIKEHPGLSYKELGENKGIAYALNYGIEYSIRNGCDYLITLDQDSHIDQNLITNLYESYNYLSQRDPNIAAVSPIHINIESNSPYRYKATKYFDNYIEVQELLTSGMFVKNTAFNEVGMMNDKLFIDGVDSEWCWRARTLFGKHLYMDKQIKMFHKLGEGDRTFFGQRISIATPFRCYFQYRNYFILSTYKFTPTSWIVKNGVKYLIRLVYYPLFVHPRWEYIISSLRGIYSGIKYVLTKHL